MDKDDRFKRFLDELLNVRDNPRSLVLITNGFLELLVETLIAAHCKNAKRITDDHRSYSYSTKLVLLNEMGIIPDPQFPLFDAYRKLRNRAAHEPFFEVTQAEIKNLAAKTHTDPRDLYQLSVVVFATLWGDHVDEFIPVFSPAFKQPE